MEHFSDPMWVDFVRESTPSAHRESIQRHLDQGCPECAKAHGLWRAIANVMSREQGFKVPESTELASNTVFADWRRRYVIPSRARIARLVFDSFREPLAVGVRGGISPARRLLHRAGAWSIDIGLEPEGRSVLLAGQVLRPVRTGRMGEIEIFLMSSDTVLAHALVNEFGEFQLHYEPENKLSLYVDVPSEAPIAIGLPDPNPNEAGGQPATPGSL